MEIIIDLPILFNTEEIRQKEDLALPTSIDDAVVKEMTFYDIQGVSSHEDSNGDEVYSVIHSNGCEYICVVPTDEVTDAIKAVLKMFWTKKASYYDTKD